MRGSVTVYMAASADRVWDLVSDITRVGEFSPETFEAEWLGGASGPEVGARFRGHVRRNGRGPVYWTACTVVACDPGREFAFAVTGKPDAAAPGRLVSQGTVSDVGFRKDELVLPASHSSETRAPWHGRWPRVSADAVA
jgi:Polyketide cyclase / dehydrase and lipid transport